MNAAYFQFLMVVSPYVITFFPISKSDNEIGKFWNRKKLIIHGLDLESKDLEIPAGSLRLHGKFNGCMLISCKIEL